MMKILKSHKSLIQSQIRHPVINFQHKLNKKWIISINGEEPITTQGVLDELNSYQTPHRKSKVKISLFKRKSCHRTDLEEILSILDQFRPVVSHLEVRIFLNIPHQRKLVNI